MRGTYNPSYDPKLVKKYLGWLLALVAAVMVTRGIAVVVLPVLFLYSVSKKQPEKVLHIILLSSALMMMNGTLAPQNTISTATLKVQMMLAAILLFPQILQHRQINVLSPIMSIMPYIAFMIIPSYLGWCPKVSFLKLFLFVAVFFAYYGCSILSTASGVKVRLYRSMILSVAIFFIFGSLLAYPVPSISMMDHEVAMRTGAESFYQGVTNQSQTLGVISAVLGVLVYADLVFNVQKADKLYIAIVICSAILIFMSASRTAMASLVAGIGFSTLLAMRARGVKTTWRGKVVNSMVALVIVGAMLVAVVSPLREKALNFALKYNKVADSEVSTEEVFKTRQGKWDEAMYNWSRSPYIGNGFQVSWDMQDKKIQGFKDVLSAPIEKSTWTTAILEEGGVIGMLLFVVFLFTIFSKWIQRRAYLGLSVFFVFLMCNFGEFSLFSMSMDGGLFWFLVFFGLILDYWRIQQARTPKILQPLPDQDSQEPQSGDFVPPPQSGSGPKPKLSSIKMTPKMLRRFANRNA